jgi:hypothetical protein
MENALDWVWTEVSVADASVDSDVFVPVAVAPLTVFASSPSLLEHPVTKKMTISGITARMNKHRMGYISQFLLT